MNNQVDRPDDGRRPGVLYNITFYMIDEHGNGAAKSFTAPVPLPALERDMDATVFMEGLQLGEGPVGSGKWRAMTPDEIADYRRREDQ